MGLTPNPASALCVSGTMAFAVIVLLWAALHDVAFRTVPNWMSAVLLITGCLVQVAKGTLLPGLAATGRIFLCGASCWRRGWLGGGDVKLLAAVTMLVPPSLAVTLLFDVALSGG